MSHPDALIPGFSDVCRELLESGIAIRFQATGNSMHPTIRNGDEIEVAPIRGDKLSVADIALYESSGGRVVCHRLARIERYGTDQRWIFRGDALWAGEDYVRPSQLLGIALAARRGGRRLPLRGRTARLRHAIRRWAGRIHGAFTLSRSEPARRA